MKIELDRSQAQAVAVACQVTAHDWAKGNPRAQQWAKILENVAAQLVICVLSEPMNNGNKAKEDCSDVLLPGM